MSTEQILPCPFCGADAKCVQGVTWWVACSMCGAEGPTRPTEDKCIAAWNAAPRIPTPTTPPPNTVKVRVAVSVSPDGAWGAAGGTLYDEGHIPSECEHLPGDRLSWITAYAPLPEPAAEVVGEVETP